ncbi:hypothetical protein LTR16_011470, partial [Cryomyces antarcticus]
APHPEPQASHHPRSHDLWTRRIRRRAHHLARRVQQDPRLLPVAGLQRSRHGARLRRRAARSLHGGRALEGARPDPRHQVVPVRGRRAQARDHHGQVQRVAGAAADGLRRHLLPARGGP